MALGKNQKSRFFKDGYIVVENLIDQDELTALRGHYKDIVLGHVPDFPKHYLSMLPVEGEKPLDPSTLQNPNHIQRQGPNHNRRDTQIYPIGEEAYNAQRQAPIKDPLDAVLKINAPSRHHASFDAIVRHPKIVDIIAELMGPDIKLYYDQVFAKPPWSRANRYHQDSVFWSFFASNFQITCQIMLDDATLENGCVRFIPGSPAFGLVHWDHLPTLLTEDLLAQEVAVPLKAGDATFHHSLALHCSGPNTTPHRRRGWSIHYASAATRYIGTAEETERIKSIGCLEGPEPTNGWPLIRGREHPHCI